MKFSLQSKFSFHLGGGAHHAMTDQGRGFCLINDIVIGIRKLQNEKLIKSAWVIDVDDHKGDGTAQITQGDDSIITLSIHMKEGWPLDSSLENPRSFIESNVDIPISTSENREYLKKLKAGILDLQTNRPRPDIVVIVNGADPFEFDELESSSGIKLSKDEMLERDLFLYNHFSKRKISQTYLMAGGYGSRSWEIYHQFLDYLFMNHLMR